MGCIPNQRCSCPIDTHGGNLILELYGTHCKHSRWRFNRLICYSAPRKKRYGIIRTEDFQSLGILHSLRNGSMREFEASRTTSDVAAASSNI
ncbi:unnamed protein product [Urochloa humidicola]